MSLLVEEGVSLGSLTTLKTGGTARYYVSVRTLEELKTAVAFAQQKTLPFFVVGIGSNLLAPDSGYQGVIIRMDIKGRNFDETNGGTVVATFGAGEVLDDVIADTVERGYWGLENLSYIPGTIGATPIQNVGAYGVEVSELVTEVQVYDTEAQEYLNFSPADCLFGYRDSIFKTPVAKKYIITSVTFNLTTVPTPRLSYASLQTEFENTRVTQQIIRAKIISIRNTKFPDWRTVGTAGSFFKNPIIPRNQAGILLQKYPDIPTYYDDNGNAKVLLGYILDKICGLRGYTKGHVHLHPAQALVLVAKPGSTTHDIELFADEIRLKVFEKTNIDIDYEVTKIL